MDKLEKLTEEETKDLARQEYESGLKMQYGSIFCLELELNDKKFRGYLKRPGRVALQASMSIASTGKVIDANEVILRACWVGGDEEILKNEELLISASMSLEGLVNYQRGELKKL